jgi:hypothetical protein
LGYNASMPSPPCVSVLLHRRLVEASSSSMIIYHA